MAGGELIVERRDVRVMFRRAADEQEAITRAWAEVEDAIGRLRGRKFYGCVDPTTGEWSWLDAPTEIRRDRISSSTGVTT